MGQKIVLTENFTDTSLPILYDDAMQAAGTLAIMDLGHSLGGFTGVPVEGSLIPNVAWRTANPLVAGSPGQSALSLIFTTNTAQGGEASVPLKERTSKKGLNIIYSQANDVAGKYNKIRLPNVIWDYVKANPNHSYYWSAWHRMTRSGLSGAPYGAFMNLSIMTGTGLMACQYATGVGAGLIPGNNKIGGDAAPGYNTVSNQITQFAVSAAYGDISSLSATSTSLYQWGNGGPFNNTHIAHSGVLYRTVFEDLTVSGRTYAQAKAVDDAMWTAAFASGGKFYNDVYTDVTGYP